MRKRRILYLLLCAALAGAAFLFFTFPAEPVAFKGIPDPSRGDVPGELSLVFTGDIMLSRSIGSIMEKRNDWLFPFRLIEEEIVSADIAFGNLESPISRRGKNVGSMYSFRADPRSVHGLVFAGFDVLSFANNHVWDYGEEAFLDTLQVLEENGIASVGAGATGTRAHAPVIIERGETRIAYLAYSEFVHPFLRGENSSPAVAFLDMSALQKDINRAHGEADIVIVSVHWGEEYETVHNERQEHFARGAIDAGADMVVGHHPHVIQDSEVYRGKHIAYSLGNFVFDQNFSPETGRGLMLKAAVKDGAIVSVESREVRFNDLYQPYVPE